jgi:thioredoxin 1
MKNITAETWQEDVLDQDLVLVDFWASWCAPCKMMLPVLEQLEAEIETLTVVKVNADENPLLVTTWEVNSIPTMLLFKKGELVERLTGAKPRGVMLEKVTPYV